MHEPKWAVIRPEMKKLYIANGDGQLRVFDSDTYQPRNIVHFKEKTNNLRYDETSAEVRIYQP